MLTRRIFRDPTAEAGGAAPVAEAPAAPAIVTPQSYGGSGAHAEWEDPYNDPKFQAQLKPQPPAIGGNALPATAAGSQGGQVAQPTPAGVAPAPDTSTTAPAEPGQAAGEVKGAWSDEDQKYLASLEAKDPAFKGMPYHPAVEKLARNNRELEAKFTQGQQYLGTVNQTIEDFKSVLQSGDPAEIAKMVEHFGGEVQFDVRKAEDKVNEIKAGYQSLVEVFRSMSDRFPPEAVPAINQALEAYANQLNGQVEGITREQQDRERIRKEIERVTGVQQKQIGNPYERYKAPAQANITALEREMNDPHFWDYYNEIKDAFAPGGMFHAQQVTVGKAFGASPDSARYYMNIAKGLWLAKNMPRVISQHEQAWLKKHQGNGAVGAPPKGAGAVTAPQSTENSLHDHEKAMEEHMRRRNGG